MKQMLMTVELGLLLALFFLAEVGRADVALQGSLDLRPSWVTSEGSFRAENEIGAFLQFNPDFLSGYVQEFQTGDSSALVAGDGYFKADITLSDRFGFEPRLILPTRLEEREAGLVFATRFIGKAFLIKGANYSLEIWESPIVPIYSQRAEEGRTFENRVELIPRASFFKNTLAFKLPLIWQQIYNQLSWETLIWLNPEVVYSLAENTGIGLSYYRGVAQMVFQQAF